MITRKYTCLLFGEGRKDKNFLYALSELSKFKYYTKNWHFKHGNWHGCSAFDVVDSCKKEKTGEEDVVLCFIDLDDLKSDYPDEWDKKILILEEDSLKYNINIIWQIDSAEDEYKKVLGNEYKNINKHRVNKAAKDNIEKFINSDLWKRILKPIVDFENSNK
ncbi:MAG: hypothetical protein ACWGHO_04805 [Candidatus Moraniibacteriota bacterium]